MLLGDASAFESAPADGIGAGCADEPTASNEPNDSSALFFDGRIAGDGIAGGAAAGAAACGAARRSADGDSGSLSARFADGPLAFSSHPFGAEFPRLERVRRSRSPPAIRPDAPPGASAEIVSREPRGRCCGSLDAELGEHLIVLQNEERRVARHHVVLLGEIDDLLDGRGIGRSFENRESRASDQSLGTSGF